MAVTIAYILSIPASPGAAAAETEGEIVEITDHGADALTRLIQQYKGSPRIQALLCAFLDPVGDAEADVYDLLTEALDISVAVGDQLDLIGEIVGEVRNGRTDADYRKGLRTKIRINRSHGRIEDLIEVAILWELITADNAVEVEEKPPAAVVVTLHSTPLDPFGLFDRLYEAKAAGVALRLFYLPLGGAATFETSGTYATITKSATQGYSSVYATGTGGGLAGVVS